MEFFIFFSLIVVLLLLRIVVFNKRSEVNIIKFEEKIKIIKSLYGILNSTKPDFKYLDYVSFIYQHSHGTIYYEYVVKNLNKFVYYFINMVHTFLILLFLFFLLISFLFIEFVMFFFIFFYKIFSNSIKIKFDFNKLNEIFLKKPLQFLGSILVFPLFLLVEFSFYLFDILDLIVFVFSHIYVILYNRFIVPTLLLISFIKFGGSLFYNFYSFLFLSLRSFLSLRIRRSHYGRKFTRRLLGPSLKVKDNLIYFFFYKSRTSINDPLVYNKFFFFY